MAFRINTGLPQAGLSAGQMIGSAFGQLGGSIGGMLTRGGEAIREGREDESAQQQFQQILAANQNNPSAMRAQGQQMMVNRDPNMQRLGKMLVDEANRIEGVQKAKAEKGTAQGIQGGLSAITQAAARGTPLEQLQEAVGSVVNLGGTQAQIMSAYQAGVDIAKARKPEPTQFDYTEKTVMRDGKPVVVQFGISKTDPSVTIERVLGPAEQKEGGTVDKKTLKELITDAGLDPQDYDITTLEGLKKLRSFVVTDVQNASLANTVSDMIKEMTPPGVQESVALLRDIDPKFVAAEADLERVERFKALTALTDEDVSGLRNVIERVVSGTTESDIKAVQELQAFRGNKDIINKLKDFALGITSGRLSEETVQEYGSIMEILGALANQRQMNTINNLIINGSPRETEAALKAKSFYSGSEQARIL
jgi:hypothetical protein